MRTARSCSTTAATRDRPLTGAATVSASDRSVRSRTCPDRARPACLVGWRCVAIEISQTALPLFVLAGWHPERKVPLPETLDRVALRGHPAVEVLESLSGLHVGTCGRGIECARGDLEF